MNSLYLKVGASVHFWLGQCKSLLKDQRGVTAVEYALIAAAMAAIVLAVIVNGGLSEAMETAIDSVAGAMTDAAAGGSTPPPAG